MQVMYRDGVWADWTSIVDLLALTYPPKTSRFVLGNRPFLWLFWHPASCMFPPVCSLLNQDKRTRREYDIVGERWWWGGGVV